MQAISGNEIDCAAIHEIVHDFVLAAAAADQRNRIEQHCADCPRCRELVDGLLRTASMLALTSTPVSPPRTAKAALFARIAQTASHEQEMQPVYLGSLTALRTPTIPASPGISAPSLPKLTGTPNRDRWSRLGTFAAPLATLPLLLALGFVGYWGITTRMALNDRSNTVEELNAEIQFLNNKVDEFSLPMPGIEEYLSPGNAKQYAMVDPRPESIGAQAYGLLIAHPLGEDAVLMAWKLDPSVDTYEVLIELSSGEIISVTELYTDSDGDAMKILDLGQPLSQVASVHVKPKANGISTDSHLASTLPDALFATIWPGLGREQDTIPVQP